MAQRTMPQTMATKKAYACSQPRNRGLPMSTGFRRVGAEVVMVTTSGYDTVGYLKVVKRITSAVPRLIHQDVAMRIRQVGANALLLECDDAGQVEAWRAELWRRREVGGLVAVDIVPAARTVLVDGVPDPAATAELIGRWTPHPGDAAAPGQLVRIPTTYDGADLPEVAAHWATSVADVVDRLSRTEFRVAFCGFAPGFAYLTGLPGPAVPRRATPRPRVPAGSVALAGPYAGIYPTASPGGWQLVGHTDVTLFDVHRDPPALLTPGTRVHLVPA